uniref:Uncharacterized protein n=1 Tax=Panagrolaimus sp. PS1159 TaxID=55785 RepID=A0AC35FBS3_9BILA
MQLNKLFCLKCVEYSKKLEETQPKIDEAKAAVDEKKKELDDLMTKLKEQKKTITKRQNNEKLKLQKCDLSLNKTKTRKEEKEKEIVKEEKKIKTLTDRPEKNNAEIEELKLELDTVKEIIEEKQPISQERLAECQQKTHELNNDRIKIGEKLAAAKQKGDEANAELTLAQSQKISMTEEVKRCENRIKSSNKATERSSWKSGKSWSNWSSTEKVKRDFDAIYEKISGTLKKEVDEKKARQTEIEGKIKTLRTAASKAEIDLQKSNEKFESMQKAVADMEEELQRLEENKVAIKEEIDELSAFLEEKKRESEAIKVTLEAAQAEINGVDEKEVGLKREIANGNHEIAKLKDEHVEAKFAEITRKIEKLKT